MRRKRNTAPKFRSRAESYVADWLTKNGIKWYYERNKMPYQSPVKMGWCSNCRAIKGIFKKRNYIPDFEFHDYTFALEVKGKLDGTGRQKLLDIFKSWPGLDLRLLLLSNNKLSKNSTKRYADWCKEHNITYCIKELPLEWFKVKNSDR